MPATVAVPAVRTLLANIPQLSVGGRMWPNPSVNRTTCKLRLQVRSGLRPPPAGYVER